MSQEESARSIFDRIDEVSLNKSKNSVSPEKINAFIEEIGLSKYVLEETQRLSEAINEIILHNLENGFAEGLMEYKQLELFNETESRALFTKARDFFGIQENDVESLSELWKKIYKQFYNFDPRSLYTPFSLVCHPEFRYLEGTDKMYAMRVVMTDLCRQVIEKTQELLNPDHIQIMLLDPVIVPRYINSSPGKKEEYIPMGEWVNTACDGELKWESLIYYKADEELIRYAEDKGILKKKDPQSYFTHLIREKGRPIVDNDTEIPYANQSYKLSWAESQIVGYRKEKKLCIFCGSGQVKRALFKADYLCAKCKRSRGYIL